MFATRNTGSPLAAVKQALKRHKTRGCSVDSIDSNGWGRVIFGAINFFLILAEVGEFRGRRGNFSIFIPVYVPRSKLFLLLWTIEQLLRV